MTLERRTRIALTEAAYLRAWRRLHPIYSPSARLTDAPFAALARAEAAFYSPHPAATKSHSQSGDAVDSSTATAAAAF